MFLLSIVPISLRDDSNLIKVDLTNPRDKREHEIMALEALYTELLMKEEDWNLYRHEIINDMYHETGSLDMSGQPMITADKDEVYSRLQQLMKEELDASKTEPGDAFEASDRIAEVNAKVNAGQLRINDVEATKEMFLKQENDNYLETIRIDGINRINRVIELENLMASLITIEPHQQLQNVSGVTYIVDDLEAIDDPNDNLPPGKRMTADAATIRAELAIAKSDLLANLPKSDLGLARMQIEKIAQDRSNDIDKQIVAAKERDKDLADLLNELYVIEPHQPVSKEIPGVTYIVDDPASPGGQRLTADAAIVRQAIDISHALLEELNAEKTFLDSIPGQAGINPAKKGDDILVIDGDISYIGEEKLEYDPITRTYKEIVITNGEKIDKALKQANEYEDFLKAQSNFWDSIISSYTQAANNTNTDTKPLSELDTGITPLPLSQRLTDGGIFNETDNIHSGLNHIMQKEAVVSTLALNEVNYCTDLKGIVPEELAIEVNNWETGEKRITADGQKVDSLLSKEREEVLKLLENGEGSVDNFLKESVSTKLDEIIGKENAANERIKILNSALKQYETNPDSEFKDIPGVTYLDDFIKDKDGNWKKSETYYDWNDRTVEHKYAVTTEANTIKSALESAKLYKQVIESAKQFWSSVSDKIKDRPKKDDINNDGKVDKKDLKILQKALDGKKDLTDAQFKAADLDGDGKLTKKDKKELKKLINPPRPKKK